MQAALVYSHFALNQPKLLTDTNLAFLIISLVFPLCGFRQLHTIKKKKISIMPWRV